LLEPEAMANRNIVVIGASLGGVRALQDLLSQLPADLDAALFVVQHTTRLGRLEPVLAPSSALPVRTPADGEHFASGTVYVAPADRHMLVDAKTVQVVRGPRENGARPAIDPLFRSAAAHHGPRVVGVLLTGLRDDGAAGLHAIRRSGGATVVQDPQDAAFPDMPSNALAEGPVDHVIPLRSIAEAITRLSKEPAPAGTAPDDVIREARITARYSSSSDGVENLGELTQLDCPECGGPLWQIEQGGGAARFRCRLGHALTARSLQALQDEEIERSLLVAMRTLEERSRMLDRLNRQALEQGRALDAERFGQDRDETAGHADVLRELLLSIR
jgi:two-component system chemotaxis response regulator CheB